MAHNPISLLPLALMLLSTLTSAAQIPPKIFIADTAEHTISTASFLQKNIPACTFVASVDNVDVHIFISHKIDSTGSETMAATLIGMNTLAGKKDNCFYKYLKGQTMLQMQASFTELVQQSLVYLFHHTQWQNIFTVPYKPVLDTAACITKDKWRGSNFIPAFSGRTEGETNSGLLELNAGITARRITNTNKFIVNVQHKTQRNSYTYETEKIITQVNSLNILPLYVHSLTNHWSAGITAQYQMDEYKNLAASYRMAPVVEYNILPYPVSAQNQLRLVYQTGVINYRYRDTTVQNKTKETRGYQRLALIADINRGWGSVRSSVQANAFLNNTKQNRITFNTLLSVQLFKGLAFNVQGQFEIVNDQVSLLKHPLSDDTYLLDGQQLPTKYYLWADFGFTYTFGNVLNNIINPRMGQIDEIGF